MKRQNLIKLLAIVLVICTLFGTWMLFAQAEDETETEAESETETVFESETEGDKESETNESETGTGVVPTDEFKLVFDFAEQLTSDKRARLEQILLDIRSAYAGKLKNKDNPKLYVVTVDRSKQGQYWGEDFLRDQHLSQSETSIILILTKSSTTWYYDMYTYGEAASRISDLEVERILDNGDIYDNLKNASHGDNLSVGVENFFRASMKAYAGRYGASVLKIMLISLIISILIGAIVCGSVMGKYAMKKRPTIYPLEKYTTLELRDSHDQFRGSYVRTRRIQSSGSSSHGSGSGGGSGHRGGR